MKTVFEKYEVEYANYGDYLLPKLRLPKQRETTIGIWGQRHQRYLKENHKVMYYDLLTSGKLYEYLIDIDEQAKSMYESLIESQSAQENITENLKANDPIKWVAMMNNIQNQAREIVNTEVIYI